MIKAIIFDFDGLILDTETPYYERWAAIYDDHGCELTLAKWSEALGTGDHFDPHDHLEELTGRSLDRVAIHDQWRAAYRAQLELRGLLPGVRDYIEAAKAMGLGLAVASSSTRDWVEGQLRRYEIHHHFSHFRCRDDVHKTKPDPAVYLAALEALGVEAREAFALEDSPNGVKAAKAAGLYCVAVPNALSRNYPLEGADMVLGSMAEMGLRELVGLVEGAGGY